MHSPGNIKHVITVGSVGLYDKESSFSNHGKCVNIMAPGEYVESTWLNGKSSRQSGSSMAAPHVTGALAVLLSQRTFSSVKEGMSYLLLQATQLSPYYTSTESPSKLVYLNPAYGIYN